MKRSSILVVSGVIIMFFVFTVSSFATADKAGREYPFIFQNGSLPVGGPADDYPQMPGFPIMMGVGGMFSPTEGPIQVDIDGDGDLEIFAGSTNNLLYGWHHNGGMVNAFPVNTGGPIQASPSAGDIDGDGDLEVVVGNRSGLVCAYHHTGAPVAGWPRTTGDEIAINSVTLWDFDGNGDYEVLVGSDRLYVWDGNGSNLPGFPVNFSGNQYGTCSTSGVGDIDGDGDAEIILEGWNYLNAFHHDGSVVAGWPYALTGSYGFSYAAPSLVDFDGDGECEIFCASHQSPGSNSLLYGIDGNGTNLPGFPQNITGWTYSTPALGDMDGDAQIEIMLLCNSAILYAFNPNGSPVPGWPINFGQYNCEAALAMADFDNNGLMDVLFGNNGGTSGYKYYCYRADGTLHPDFPFTMSGATLPTCSAIADADRDGDMEIAHHVMNGTVYLWTAHYSASFAYKPWPQPHHDIQHTGNFHHHDNYSAMVVLTPYGTPIVIPPGGGSFNFNIALSNTGTIPANFDVWSMVELPSGAMYGPLIGPVQLNLGAGASVNRDRTQSIPASAPSGQYIYYSFIGNYPAEIVESDSFTFTKAADGEGLNQFKDWKNAGENWDCQDCESPASEFRTMKNYPNPFNAYTTFKFNLKTAGYVFITIYDLNGREVARLADGWYQAGCNEVGFGGSELPSGVYFAILKGPGFSETIKVVLIK